MEIKCYEDVDPVLWNNILSKNIDIHNIFQRYEWALLMKECYGYVPFFAFISDGDVLRGGLLYFKKPVMKIFCAYETCGGPLYVNSNQFLSIKSETIKHLACLSGHPLYVSIRSRANDTDETYYIKHSFLKSIFYTIIIDTTRNENVLWDSFNKNARNSIRKAQKNDVEIKEANNWSIWLDFYKLHVAHSQKRKISPKNLKFFKFLYDVFLPNNLCKLLIAYKDNALIGGSLSLSSNGVVTDYLGAIDDLYRKFSINDLIMWETIKLAIENGSSIFDLGDTWPNPQSYLYNIHVFKSKWGGHLIENSFFIKGEAYRFGRNLVLNNKLVGNIYESFHRTNLI